MEIDYQSAMAKDDARRAFEEAERVAKVQKSQERPQAPSDLDALKSGTYESAMRKDEVRREFAESIKQHEAQPDANKDLEALKAARPMWQEQQAVTPLPRSSAPVGGTRPFAPGGAEPPRPPILSDVPATGRVTLTLNRNGFRSTVSVLV